jgi:hypothetical protein
MARIGRTEVFMPATAPPDPGVLSRAGIRHALRRRFSTHPALYLPLMRRRHPGAVLDRDTQLVIDGFTRSAGTFAVVAFQLAQNDHVRVAHHLHAAAHLKAAAQRGVPAIVPIRRPEDTVLSAIIREPFVPMKQFLKSYTAFYASILPYRDYQVVATFEQVTTDFGQVIERLNTRFGTTFRAFRHEPDQVGRCLELIEERAQRPPWEHLLGDFLSGKLSADEYREQTEPLRSDPAIDLKPVPENRVQRPSEERRALRGILTPRYRGRDLSSLRKEAENLYDLIASEAAS